MDGDRARWIEVLCRALIVPLAISVLWRRLWPAGAIAGVAAFLLAVTAVVFGSTRLYRVAETVISGPEGTGLDVRENLQGAALAAPGS